MVSTLLYICSTVPRLEHILLFSSVDYTKCIAPRVWRTTTFNVHQVVRPKLARHVGRYTNGGRCARVPVASGWKPTATVAYTIVLSYLADYDQGRSFTLRQL